VVVTVVGLIFGGVVLYGVIALLAILTNFTALQRIREVCCKAAPSGWRSSAKRRLPRGAIQLRHDRFEGDVTP